MNVKRSLLGLATALLTAGAAGSYAQAGEFDGVTVNVMTQTGAIQEPLQRRAPDFEKLTGAKINVIAVPFSDLYQKLLTDWASGTNSVDAAVFAPQWMVDYIAGGFLEDLSDRVAKDTGHQAGRRRRRSSATSREKYDGKIYMITLDGDFHMMYYRTDVLEAAGLKPPTTWDDYLAVAKAVNGKDMNGDGTPDFGSCIAKKRNAQSYWFVTDVVGSMTQSKGTSQGAFFNTEDMTPLVDNEAFRKALDFLKESTKYGPPNEINLDVGDTRPLFTSGRCALNLDWGDVGTLAIDPATSKVIDKGGAAIMPGSKQVLELGHRQARRLHARTPAPTPSTASTTRRSRPSAAGAAASTPRPIAKVKDAAYAFFSYMTQPAQSNVDVTIGKHRLQPLPHLAVRL